MKFPKLSFPTSTSVVIATVSWVFTSWREEEGRYLENYRKKVNSRLEKLYGPLHGNRMIYKGTTALSPLGNHSKSHCTFSANLQSIERRYAKKYPDCETGYLKSIQHHVQHVCLEKDEAALEDWRGFYRRNLQPLDKKALEIIQKYCHLISTDTRKGQKSLYLHWLDLLI